MKINFNLFSLNFLNSKNNIINLRPGDIIEAKIIDIIDDNIILKGNNGEIFKAISTDIDIKKNFKNLISKVVKFTITNINIENNKISIELLFNNVNNETKNKMVLTSSFLSNFSSLESSKENIQILIDAMLKNQIPITVSKAKYISYIKKCYNKVFNYLHEIHSNDNFRNMKVDILLKKLVLDTNKKTALNETPITPLQYNSHEIKEKYFFLNNVTYHQLAFMYKNKIEFTIDNLMLLHNLFLGKNTITDQIKTIFNNKYLIDNSQIKLISLIKSLIVDEKYLNSEKVKSIYDILLNELNKFKSYNIKNNFTNDYIESKINELKGSIEFLNNLNQNIIFIQVPILINNKIFNFEILTKKKNRNRTYNESYKILISLDTHRLGRISVLIEIIKGTIKLNFKIKSSSVKDLIVKNESFLSERIKKIGFKQVNYCYKIDFSQENNLDFWFSFQETKGNNKIDLRV